jgi:hypothetical protein
VVLPSANPSQTHEGHRAALHRRSKPRSWLGPAPCSGSLFSLMGAEAYEHCIAPLQGMPGLDGFTPIFRMG